MTGQTSGLKNGRDNWLRALIGLGAGALLVGTLNLGGCPGPTYTQMFTDVTLADINDIKNDDDLDTDAKKIEALENLGITDEQVQQFLLTATLPDTSDED